MKKIILFLSILIAGIYLSNFIGAITVTKNSGEVLDNSIWTNISSLTNKVDVSSSDIKLSGKLYVTGDLCTEVGGVKSCLGKCLEDGYKWDSITNSCVAPKVIKVAGGQYFTAALKEDGSVRTWGYNNYGQLGRVGDNTKPGKVETISDVKDIALGMDFMVVLKEDETVRAWGHNDRGQLGNNNKESSSTPVRVKDLTEVVQIDAGYFHAAALKRDKTVWSWGENSQGMLGDLSTESSSVPVKSSITDVEYIGVGQRHTCAIKGASRELWCWGRKNYGAVKGTGNNHTPTQSPGITGVEKVAGHRSTVIIKGGSVEAWGRFSSDMTSLTGITKVDAGRGNILALKSNGTVWGGGTYNSSGELGDGTTDAPTPITQTKKVTGITDIGAGRYHGIAVDGNGKVWVWGKNDNGQLGTGDDVQYLEPTEIKF
ncbi:MAG: hypothetical protein N4A38_05260 [Candidatus Gracilibacteria bacterium]|nr:hypothetical protein [Candidatus Gracilibacteria bacterium]